MESFEKETTKLKVTITEAAPRSEVMRLTKKEINREIDRIKAVRDFYQAELNKWQAYKQKAIELAVEEEAGQVTAEQPA